MGSCEQPSCIRGKSGEKGVMTKILKQYQHGDRSPPKSGRTFFLGAASVGFVGVFASRHGATAQNDAGTPQFNPWKIRGVGSGVVRGLLPPPRRDHGHARPHLGALPKRPLCSTI